MEQTKPFANLLEKLLAEGEEDEIRYLVMDALETLDEHEEKALVASQFGEKTQTLWTQMPHLPQKP